MLTDPLGTLGKSTYNADVKAAYDVLATRYHQLGRGGEGGEEPIFQTDDAVVRAEIFRFIGECGAAVGAAGKREKRRLLLIDLVKAHAKGVDITPAVANNSARRLLKRGVSRQLLAKLFATPGRTPDNKSEVGAENLAAIEAKLTIKLDEATAKMNEARAAASEKWRSSATRAKIIEDWRQQRTAQLKEAFKE